MESTHITTLLGGERGATVQILRIMLVSYSTSTACNQLGSMFTCMWTSFDPFSSFYDFYLYLFIAYIVLAGSLPVYRSREILHFTAVYLNMFVQLSFLS